MFCKQDTALFPILSWKYAVILRRQASWLNIRKGNLQPLSFMDQK